MPEYGNGWLAVLAQLGIRAGEKLKSHSRQVMGGRVCGCPYNSSKANLLLGRHLSASGHQPQALGFMAECIWSVQGH